MAELFVDMCAFCKQGVLKTEMDYQKGKVFHAKCFTEHGGTFATPNSELASLSARTRVELVQLKNIQVRSELEKQAKKPAKKIAKKTRPKKKKAKPKAKAKSGKRKTGKAKKQKKVKRRR